MLIVFMVAISTARSFGTRFSNKLDRVWQWLTWILGTDDP